MIFIEGFGTFIPYLIYLFLIWICLIFGFRGQLSKVVCLFHSKNLVLENPAPQGFEKSTFQNFNTFRKEVRAGKPTNLSRFYDSFLFAPFSLISYLQPMNLTFCYNLCHVGSFSHRGPPVEMI
jgi:hypothetical protein